MSEVSEVLDMIYERMDGSEVSAAYSKRHGIESAAILTVYDDETADLIAGYLAPRIEGRVVVEIGGGIGILAFHMAKYAKRIYCIEANPMWSWTFAELLLAEKPKNVSYLFGAADEFSGQIRGDVALFCTHSDAAGMAEVGSKFAREVIDVYRDMLSAGWNQLRDLSMAELNEWDRPLPFTKTPHA